MKKIILSATVLSFFMLSLLVTPLTFNLDQGVLVLNTASAFHEGDGDDTVGGGDDGGDTCC